MDTNPLEEYFSASIVTEIEQWTNDPELSKVAKPLMGQIENLELFWNHSAEVMVARHLCRKGYSLQVEVPTYAEKRADFKASKGQTSFFIHVKQSNRDEVTKTYMQQRKSFALWLDDKPRLARKLRDAYDQFMPNETNIILLTSAWEVNALLSTSIWQPELVDFEDALRGNTGFWSANLNPESNIAAWFSFNTKSDFIRFKLIYRRELPISAVVDALFDTK